MFSVICVVCGLLVVINYAITEDTPPNFTMAMIGVVLILCGLLT